MQLPLTRVPELILATVLIARQPPWYGHRGDSCMLAVTSPDPTLAGRRISAVAPENYSDSDTRLMP
ncbi:MAG: hypothetical protein WBM41_13780, partial [Arenicellales bacterium]